MTLGCGHEAKPNEKAYDREGRTYCYPCAEARERADFLSDDRGAYGCYPSEDLRSLQTWTGAELAPVVRHSTYRSNWGVTMHSWTARDARGRVWYGQNAGPGMLLIVRRRAAEKVAA